jgi:dihydrodipicolinate synthase/N-acetylneuraminate lyase
MSRLKSNDLCGIWAGVTMCWDEAFDFDEANYITNTEAMCGAGVHGIYTTGSTGEFYALDFDEFKRMVDIQALICGRMKMPLQIGCCSDNTRATIRLMEYAAGKKQVGACQVNLPYWMELNDREVLRFFKDLYQACPDMPLVHYNIPRAKRFLNGSDYRKILEVVPTLVGVKYTFAGSNFGALQTALALTPRISYFVAENLLASAAMLGAKGSCSSLVATNPTFMLKMYEHIKKRRWEQAIAMQKTANNFYNDCGAYIEGLGEGTIDPVFDKGLGVASGCLKGSQRTRPPYIGWSDETIRKLRAWLKSNYPQFLYQSK